jgi:glycerol kinase
LPDGLPIAALAGDQQAALFGQTCFSTGLTKATYGTGCFILMHTGDKPVASRGGLLTTIAATADGSPAYALEGSIFVAGAAVQWCRDNLGFDLDVAAAAALAASVPDSGGVVFIPAFAGLGSPHWAPDARAAVFGMTRGTTAAHLMRAALESMAFQAQDVLEVMAREAGEPIAELRVDGGAAANDLLMQLQASLSGVPVSRPHSVESTAMGAAFLAGLAVGFWNNEAELAALRIEQHRFLPQTDTIATQRLYQRWRAAVQVLLAANLEPLGNTDP